MNVLNTLLWTALYTSLIYRTNVAKCAGSQPASGTARAAGSSRQTALAQPARRGSAQSVAANGGSTAPGRVSSSATPPSSGSITPRANGTASSARKPASPLARTSSSAPPAPASQSASVSTPPATATTPANVNGTNGSGSGASPATIPATATTPESTEAGEAGEGGEAGDGSSTSEETEPVQLQKVDLNIEDKKNKENVYEYKSENDVDIFTAKDNYVFHKLFKGKHELKELTDQYSVKKIEVSYDDDEKKILLTCIYGESQRVVFNIPDPSKSLSPVELNININQSENNIDLKITGNDKTFTPAAEHAFSKVFFKLSSGTVTKEFYVAANASEYSSKVEHRGTGQSEQKLLIHLLNGHVKTWKKMGAAAQWEMDTAGQTSSRSSATRVRTGGAGAKPTSGTAATPATPASQASSQGGTAGSQPTSGSQDGSAKSADQTNAQKIAVQKSKLSVFTLKADGTEAANDANHYVFKESGAVLDYVFKSEFKCVKVKFDNEEIVKFSQKSESSEGGQPSEGTANGQASTDPNSGQEKAKSVPVIQDHPISAQFNLEVLSVLFIMPNEDLHFFAFNSAEKKWEHLIDKKPVACVLDANASAGTSQYNCSTGGSREFSRDHKKFSSATPNMKSSSASSGGSTATQPESTDNASKATQPKPTGGSSSTTQTQSADAASTAQKSQPESGGAITTPPAGSDPNSAKQTQPDASEGTKSQSESTGGSTDASSGGSSGQSNLQLQCTSDSERHYWTKPKYAFNRVKVNTYTFHETECPSEYAWRLAYTGISTNDQIITLYLLNGRTKKFTRAGDDQGWTPSDFSPVTNVELDVNSEAAAEYSCTKQDGAVTFTTRGGFYAFTKIKDGQTLFFDKQGDAPAALKVIVLGRDTDQMGAVIHLSNGSITKLFKNDASNWVSVPSLEKDKIEFVTEGQAISTPASQTAGQGSTAKPADGQGNGTKPNGGKGADGTQSPSSEGSGNSESDQTGTNEGTNPNGTSSGGTQAKSGTANQSASNVAITETNEYKLTESGALLDYKFKPGLKCVGVKYDGKDLWKCENDSEGHRKAAVCVQFYLDLQLALVKLEDSSLAMYDFVGSGWALTHKGMPKPVLLDVNSTNSTSEYKVVSGNSRLFIPGPGFGFKKIIGQNMIFYETKFEDEYATKVEYKGYAVESRDIEITLPSGKVMIWNKFDKHKFWKDVTVYEPIKLDIACKKSTPQWEYQEALGIDTYISKVGYGFYHIYKNNDLILNLSDRVNALQQQSKTEAQAKTGTQQPANEQQQPANQQPAEQQQPANQQPAEQQQPATKSGTDATQTQTSTNTPALPTDDQGIKNAQQYVARSIAVKYENNQIELDCCLLQSRRFPFTVPDPSPDTSASGTSAGQSADGASTPSTDSDGASAGDQDGQSGDGSSQTTTIELDLMDTNNANYTFSVDDDDFVYEAKSGVKFSKVKKGSKELKSFNSGKEAVKIEASFTDSQVMLCVYESTSSSNFSVLMVDDAEPTNRPTAPANSSSSDGGSANAGGASD